MSNFFSRIIQPVVSEKATRLQQDGQYIFLVPGKTTKKEVENAVFHLYGVRAARVNMSRQPKKIRIVGRGFAKTKRDAVKRAIVTFEGKKTIDLYRLKEPKKAKKEAKK